MTTTIEQIKAALRQHIAEAEAATPGPWEVDTANGVMASGIGWLPICYPFGDRETELRDATFIAHARTMSPAACKCLLLAIEGLEFQARHLNYNGHRAIKSLESIRQEWHNQTTKP